MALNILHIDTQTQTDQHEHMKMHAVLLPAVALTRHPDSYKPRRGKCFSLSVTTALDGTVFVITYCQVVRSKLGCNPGNDLMFVCYEVLCVFV